jgi:hypothetical protein
MLNPPMTAPAPMAASGRSGAAGLGVQQLHALVTDDPWCGPLASSRDSERQDTDPVHPFFRVARRPDHDELFNRIWYRKALGDQQDARALA